MKKLIEHVMTPNVHTIGRDLTVEVANELMKKYCLRHLPVIEKGVIVGILSDRDAKLARCLTGGMQMKVEEAMTADPYVVAPGTLFAEVAEEMAKRKYGCAIVSEGGRPVGIFTATDGMDLLARAYR